MSGIPATIDDTWPIWVLGITLVSAALWFLVGRRVPALTVARAAAVVVAIAGVLLYAWFAYEELVQWPPDPRNRLSYFVDITLYLAVPALAPLFLLRRTSGSDARRVAAALGIVVVVVALTLGGAAFALLAWASQVGDRGVAMLVVLSPLGVLAVTGVTLARSAWRAARE